MASIYTLLLNNLAKVTRKCFSLWKKKQRKVTNVYSAQNWPEDEYWDPRQMHQGKSHWRGTKRVSCSCHGQALEPGSIRLTCQHPENTGARLDHLRAGSLCSGSSPGHSEPAGEARTPAPVSSLHSCRPTEAGHARSQGTWHRGAADSFGLLRALGCISVTVLEQAKLRMLHLAERYGGKVSFLNGAGVQGGEWRGEALEGALTPCSQGQGAGRSSNREP